MRKQPLLLAGMSVLLLAGPALAADHLFTGVGAGGLTTSSQPFMNGTTNPGRAGTSVPGQGSPLSGQDRTTPAVETEQLLQRQPDYPEAVCVLGMIDAALGKTEQAIREARRATARAADTKRTGWWRGRRSPRGRR